MCGIAGAIGNINTGVIDAVKRINEAQIHRGPDGEGIWYEQSPEQYGIVLAHRRLAIIDLSQDGSQPMRDITNGNTIVFNGEIYNYIELKDELKKHGHEFHTNSDTEVILIAYRHWGEGFESRLRGMFAFVIWDIKARIAVMVRDRLGIKPLYYTNIEKKGRKSLLFASEMSALLESGLITKKKLNPNAVSSYIWNGFVAGPSSLVSGIDLLPAGNTMIISESGKIIKNSRFWNLPSTPQSYADTVDVKGCLEDATNLHMVSDVPVGVFLSGGIDSSAVAALAASCSDTPINTFNISFNESRFDESEYARKVARALGTEHHEIQLTQHAFIENIEAGLASMDQPTFDGINTFFVSKAVAESGIKVALAGTGGDELFGGYKSFVDIPKTKKLASISGCMPESLLKMSGSFISQLLKMYYGAVPPQTRWGKLADVMKTRGDVLALYQTVYSLYTNNFRNQLLDVSHNDTDYGIDKSFAREAREIIEGQGLHEAISNLELKFFIGERLLRDTDAASMASSIEVRVPLLDHVVIEQIAKIHPDRRYQPLGRKELLRKTALSKLDKSIFERPKSGFTLPFDMWCRENLKQKVENMLTNKDLCHAVGLDVDITSQLFSAFQAEAPGIYWSRIWSLYCLLWWCSKKQIYL